MVTEQACRERGTELYEVIEKFRQHGNMFDAMLMRITAVGNKLWDESSEIKTEGKLKQEPANSIMVPGAINSLNNCSYGFTELITKFETQISKLEKLI